jgi:hypothetical protein
MSLYKLVTDVFGIPWTISPNVPAVYKVGGGIKELCEAKTTAANLP